MYEGFEPLTVSADLIDTYLPRFINIVLDHDDRQDSEEILATKLSDWLTRFIGEWIDELQDGF